MKYYIFLIISLFFIASCSENEPQPLTTPTEGMCFPYNNTNVWETKSFTSLGWKQNAIQPLKDFLIEKNTKSFIILVNGKIVMEEYFNGHTPSIPLGVE